MISTTCRISFWSGAAAESFVPRFFGVAVLLSIVLAVGAADAEAGRKNAGGTSDGVVAASPPFSPTCQDPAPGFFVIDPEFDSETELVSWQTSPTLDDDGFVLEDGIVFIAPVAADGTIMTDQRFECLDCFPAPFRVTINGPEFGRSGETPIAYFTGITEDGLSTEMVKLTPDGADSWAASTLPDSRGKVLVSASRDESLSTAKLHWASRGDAPLTERVGLDEAEYGWRDDVPFPNDMAMPSQNKFGRFMPDPWRLVVKREVKKSLLDYLLNRTFDQPALYDTETGDTTLVLPARSDRSQLSTGNRPNSLVLPELNDTEGIVAVIRNRDESRDDLVVWRELPNSDWEEWNRIAPIDPDYPCHAYVETFNFQDRAYAALVSYRRAYCLINNFPIPTSGIVWYTSLDPDSVPVQRIVSEEVDPTTVTFKIDTEVFNYRDQWVWIYYQDVRVAEGGGSLINEQKLCDSGL